LGKPRRTAGKNTLPQMAKRVLSGSFFTPTTTAIMSERRIVITGIGVVSPIGNNKDDFWKNLIAGKSGIRRIQSMDTEKYECKIAGEVVDFDPTPFFNNHKEARRADRFFQLGMAASKMAVKDSGLNPDSLDPWRVGVMVGSGRYEEAPRMGQRGIPPNDSGRCAQEFSRPGLGRPREQADA
jgi:3-oxoacyl-[acyl-carrier-protein] synthase II